MRKQQSESSLPIEKYLSNTMVGLNADISSLDLLSDAEPTVLMAKVATVGLIGRLAVLIGAELAAQRKKESSV